MDNRTLKELAASGLDNAAPLCIQYPTAAQGKTEEFELKSSLLHHIPKYHWLSMENLNKHLKEFEVYQMKEEILLQYFYEGLLPLERQMLDASAGGALVDKTPLAAKILIANRALNAQQYEGVGQRGPPRQQVHEVSSTSDIHSQLANLTSIVSQMAEGMRMQGPMVCGVCSIQGHASEKCPQLIENGGWESANAIGFQGQNQPRNDPYSNTYNPGPKPSTSGLKEDKKLQFEKEDTSPPTAKVDTSLPQASIGPNLSNSANQGKNMLNSIPTNVVPSNVPFPSRFLQSKNEEEEKDVLETFRKVHVNIPLLDAIKQIPKYAKCLKKLCTTKKRVRDKEVVHVSEKVSAILQRKLPSKCKDPGSFTIPCVIGNTRFESAMLDLGASINVMPYSIYASMNLGVLKNDGVIIQLADRSNAYPKGVLEDVLVQVNHLIFPADFYVLKMDESDHAPSLPILLGRPFMKTAQTKIDVAKGLVTMAFGGDMISFKISESIETPNVVHSCCAIDKIEKIGPDHSALGTKDASRTMQDEGIEVEHKDHTATALKMLKLAERTMGKNVHIAATSSQHIGKPPNPNPIPIKVDRWFPSLVQVPKQIPDGGRMNMNLRQHNAPINKHHYPFPFKGVIYENFVEHVVKDIPLHAVGSSGE
ncbi:unnamed protein product [Malus baccata var. baccata]